MVVLIRNVYFLSIDNIYLLFLSKLRRSPGSKHTLFPADFPSFSNGHNYTMPYFLSLLSRLGLQLALLQNPRDLAWVRTSTVQTQPYLWRKIYSENKYLRKDYINRQSSRDARLTKWALWRHNMATVNPYLEVTGRACTQNGGASIPANVLSFLSYLHRNSYFFLSFLPNYSYFYNF